MLDMRVYEAVKPGDGEPSLPMIRLKRSQTAHLLGKGPAAARKRKQGESRPVPQCSPASSGLLFVRGIAQKLETMHSATAPLIWRYSSGKIPAKY